MMVSFWFSLEQAPAQEQYPPKKTWIQALFLRFSVTPTGDHLLILGREADPVLRATSNFFQQS